MILYGELPGERLDAFLSRQVEGLTRSAAQRLLEDGCVTLRGKPGKKNDKVQPGDEVCLTIPEPEPVDIAPREMPLDIVYEDEDVLVINKPKGLVVHPAPGHTEDTLVNGLLYAKGDTLSGINGKLRPGIVHRIDKDTSGLLMVAKNDLAHQSLAAQLKNKTNTREYLALVHGNIKEAEGTIDAPLGRSPKDRKKQAVVADGRPAITHFKVLDRFGDYTLVACRLETGRTHQIRVHMKYIGHPLAGDPLYGPKKTLPGAGQYLHAAKLGFKHPVTGEELLFEAPLPPYFAEMLKKLDKRRKIN